MTTLTFNNTSLSVITQNSQIWFSISDIANALGYKETNGVTRLYNSHSDEFTPCMTTLVDTQTNGGIQKVRIFSLRGTHLIGMLSHTKVAKDFRKWVLDILDKETQKIQPNLPLIEEKTHTLTLTDRELHRLCWLWKMAEIMRQLIGFVQKPLELLGSRYAASAWGYSNEYKFSLEKTRQILVRETAHVQPDPLDRHGWNNVIHELRSGKIR